MLIISKGSSSSTKLFKRFGYFEDCFAAIFQWIAKGTRTFADLGISLSELTKYARSEMVKELVACEAQRMQLPPSGTQTTQGHAHSEDGTPMDSAKEQGQHRSR